MTPIIKLGMCNSVLRWFSLPKQFCLIYNQNIFVLLGMLNFTRMVVQAPKLLFSCSTQLSMKFFLLINVKMPTFVGIVTFMSWKNSILGLSEPKNSRISRYLCIYEHSKFHAQLWVFEHMTKA